MTAVQVVWFKRDMRVHDHAPLMQALQQRHTLGPVLCVYCIEPTLWQQPDAARQHYHFALECLADLRVQLHSLGLALHVLHGEVTSVLDALQARGGISHLWSHTETGNNASYSRDKAVAAWCARARVAWTEVAQFGVKRGLRARVGSSWAQHWQRHMATPCASVAAFTTRVQAVPVLGGGYGGHGGHDGDGGYFMDVAHEAHKANKVHGVHGAYATLGLPSAWYQQPSADALGLDPHEPHARQRGGRAAAMALLQSFIAQRSGWYRGGISSPLTAPDACSRLSPYLSMGCVSMREVVQTIEQARLNPDTPARHRQGLTAMLSRLHWHCHFIQKLETEPAIEWRNMHSGYNGLREHDWNPAHFEALKNGQTGWPMVDASVAMLKATGWINFRMRAMLVSVAAYPLWLHWRDVGTWLATQFLDYEPGIHWSQMQMQSGTTGINTTRVYNPIKQAQDHDPQAVFVRRWLPALRRVPDTWVLEPWRMPESVQRNCGVQLGRDIPMPLVDLDAATRQAKQRLHACRAQDSVRAGKAAVVKRHASQRNDSVREDAQQRSKPHNKQHNQQSDLLAQTADQRRGTKSNATATTTNTNTPEAAQQSFGF